MKSKSKLMKLWPFIELLIAILFFLIWNSKVLALAGFSERDSILHYNNFADISWGHPSDACYSHGQYCFYLVEKESVKKPFDKTLWKISVPGGLDNPFVLMKSTEERWIIYDLGLLGVMFESDSFELTLEKWKKLGLHEITLANATNLSNYFEETEESKLRNKMSMSESFVWLILIVFYLHWKFWLTVSFSILLILVVYIHERYYSSRNGRNSHL